MGIRTSQPPSDGANTAAPLLGIAGVVLTTTLSVVTIWSVAALW